MKMKVGALVICGLLAVAQNFPGAEQINDTPLETGQPGDKVKGLIEEISFSENSPAGEIGFQDDASSEIEGAPDAGENSAEQSEIGSTEVVATPKILKVKHTAQFNSARPMTEHGLGDWVFDYPK